MVLGETMLAASTAGTAGALDLAVDPGLVLVVSICVVVWVVAVIALVASLASDAKPVQQHPYGASATTGNTGQHKERSARHRYLRS